MRVQTRLSWEENALVEARDECGSDLGRIKVIKGSGSIWEIFKRWNS